MKKFKLENLEITKTDVSNLSGGICKCCYEVPPNGIAAYGAFGGCNSNVSVANQN